MARENAQAQGVADRIDFRRGDLTAPVAEIRFNYLVSNPPYISDAEWAEVEPNVKDYEPEAALRGGVDGLDFVRRLIAAAPELLSDPGQLVIEIAASQRDAVIELVNAMDGLEQPRVLVDHERLPRVLIADRV